MINLSCFFLTIVNIGKWVLKNLFISFVLEEQRRHSKDEESQPSNNCAPSHNVDSNTPKRLPSSLDIPKLLAVNSCTVVSSSNMIPAVAPIVSPTCQRTPQSTSHYSLLLRQSPIHPSTQTTEPPPAARDPTVV